MPTEQDTKQILNTSDEAAKFVTNLEGWVDRLGRFWGKDERMARWAGCTHIVCPDCGNPTPKGYTICKGCREKKAVERYEAKERKQWDRETPLYSEFADEYFFSEDSLNDYLEFGETKQALRLVICEPIYLKEIDEDYFCDELPEDGELPENVFSALEELNKIIRGQKPVSWMPGKYAAGLTLAEAKDAD